MAPNSALSRGGRVDDDELAVELQRAQGTGKADADADIEEDVSDGGHHQRGMAGERQEILPLGGDEIEHPEALDPVEQKDDDAGQRHRLEDEEFRQV